MKKIIILMAGLSLTACASTGVVQLEQDTYFIGKKRWFYWTRCVLQS